MDHFSESSTKVPWVPSFWKIISIFIRFWMVNRQALPIQIVCQTKPYKNYNFHIDGASWCFGVWLWQLAHLQISSFFVCVCLGAVLSMIKAYSLHWMRGLHSVRVNSLWIPSFVCLVYILWMSECLLHHSANPTPTPPPWNIKPPPAPHPPTLTQSNLYFAF